MEGMLPDSAVGQTGGTQPREGAAVNRNQQPWTLNIDIDRPDRDLVAALWEIETGNLADASPLVQVFPSAIRRLVGQQDFCGPALTVWTNPGDLLYPLRAADEVQPGDVVVIDGGGWTEAALIGEIFAGVVAERGGVGIVVDGAIRDLEGIAETGLSAYARASVPGKQTLAGPGAINVPIDCSGIRIEPGDIVRADATGIVVVPAAAAAEVLAAAREVARAEAGWVAAAKERGLAGALGLDEVIAANRPG
ncbi:dimethylmenaquinone methyltransferase [Enemella evansiae]|uniref:Putative 4-hydroxy-4-methyl-2-oxoglutarate aldolase n=1 Tax=Enemella evansiae TaxID=2016499 RepID=A0A255FY93_9ACTN|nr:dimethylmenaquinone methyltransferase [Enemella evansiae]OYO11419.1 dimethylmenaquinone methyltransferase [Enemella evansiae]